jgi:hypothetical protein
MRSILRLLALGLALVAPAASAVAAPKLAEFNVAPGHVTVSGLSSGAFMAHQLHVAHSDIIDGVGIFAGGPYYCAEGSQTKATGRCTCFYKEIMGRPLGAEPCTQPQGGFASPDVAEPLKYARDFAKRTEADRRPFRHQDRQGLPDDRR